MSKVELIKYQKPKLSISEKCHLTNNGMGLIFDKNISHEERLIIGRKLKLFEIANQFWIGDWINANWGRYEHGKYEEAEKLGYERKTLNKYQQVSKNIEFTLRRVNLSWTHHEMVAYLPPDKQSYWLNKAAENNWSVRELRDAIRDKEKGESPPLPEDKYNVIYADPPWQYEHPISNSRKIEKQYPTMKLENIKELEIPSAKDAILFLWSPASIICHALEVMEAWGFLFRTTAIWDKEIIGPGYWFRTQHEILLVGIKGNFHPPEPKNRVSSVYREKRSEHSKKPDYYYDLIEKMYPGFKYLELFARPEKKRKNWTYWGNEVSDLSIANKA